MSRTQPNELKRRYDLMGWGSLGLVAVLGTVCGLSLIGCGPMKARANEDSAIQSVRTIVQAQMMYASTYPANGYACDLKALGGVAGSGTPTPTAAQLLDNDLASSGHKSGYNFAISDCVKVTVNAADRITGYVLTAVPASPGKTGNRGFCTDESGQIKFDPTGGANCTQTLQ